MIRLVLLLLFAMITSPALAHFSPNSEISLEFGERDVAAHLVIPQGEWAFANGDRAMTSADVQRQVAARTADGRGWLIEVKSLRLETANGTPDWIADLTMRPPPGAALRNFTLQYDLLINQVPNHVALVHAAADFEGGVLKGEPALLGALRQGQTSLSIDRGKASGWNGFFASLRLGMRHIAEGLDHMLFLLALLIPAPLLASGGKWGEARPARDTIRALLWIITAFTIGHSLTLIGGAAFGWSLPEAPVEIAIAISVLVAALHALRPLFPAREALVATGFGLIHGMAFATVLASFALPPLPRAQAILGFNLGIELVQIGLMLVIMPALVWLARRPAYASFRTIGATFIAGAALFWIVERTFF